MGLTSAVTSWHQFFILWLISGPDPVFCVSCRDWQALKLSFLTWMGDEMMRMTTVLEGGM